MNNLHNYRSASTRLATEFFDYYLWETDYELNENGSTIYEVGDHYFSIGDIVTVLSNKERYTPEVISAWDSYTLDCEEWYYLSLFAFAGFYNEYKSAEIAQSFVDWYKEYSDKNRAYWDSPEAKAIIDKQMAELKDKFALEINKISV